MNESIVYIIADATKDKIRDLERQLSKTKSTLSLLWMASICYIAITEFDSWRQSKTIEKLNKKIEELENSKGE